MKTPRFLASLSVALAGLACAASAHAGPSLRSLAIGAQAPELVAAGAQAIFPLAVTRTGYGSLSFYLSFVGLPAGATATFVLTDLTFADLGPSTKQVNLLIRVDPATLAGSYPFTVIARHGTGQADLSATAVLVVGGSRAIIQQPVLDPPLRLPDGTISLTGHGTANQPFTLQATSDLSTGIWATIVIGMAGPDGLFSAIDQDVPKFPMRFYRAAQ